PLIPTLSLHDALPIWQAERDRAGRHDDDLEPAPAQLDDLIGDRRRPARGCLLDEPAADLDDDALGVDERLPLLAHGFRFRSDFAATRARHRRSSDSIAESRNGLTSDDSWTSTAATVRDKKFVLSASTASIACSISSTLSGVVTSPVLAASSLRSRPPDARSASSSGARSVARAADS